VRAEHRDVDPAEFFEALRGEQVMPLGRHICDEMPDEFGWRIWFSRVGAFPGTRRETATYLAPSPWRSSAARFAVERPRRSGAGRAP